MPGETPKPDQRVVTAYLNEVDAELTAAKRLLEDPPSRYAAFHVEQAAEKLIKAVRLHRGLYPTKEHDLGLLIDGLPAGDDWRGKLEPLAPLSVFSTAYRYPSPTGNVKSGPPVAELMKWIDSNRELLVEARAALLG